MIDRHQPILEATRVLPSVLLLAWFILIAFVPQATSQEVDSFAIARSLNHRNGYYSFDGNGRLQTSQMETIANTNAKFFEDKIVQKEIELVEHQQAEYNAIIRDWHKSWEDTIKEIQRAHKIKPLTREETIQMFADCDEESIKQLRKVLLPHQFAIIHELQFRCLFRTQGLKPLLKNKGLRESLGLSEQACDKLIKAGRDSRKEVVKQALEARNETIKILLQPLSEEQRQAFAKKWAYLFIERQDCSIEELIVFLDPESYAWILKDAPPIKKLLSRPSYETGAAGNLVMTPGPKYSNDDLNVFRSFWNNKDFSKWLGLDSAEHKLINEIVRNSYKSSDVLLKLSIASDEVSAVPYEVRKKAAYAESRSMDSKSVEDLKAALGVEGWNRVEDFAELINKTSAGPVYDLLKGELSEQLELSESQKTKLKKSASEARDYLIGKTKEIEQFVVHQLVSAVDETNQKKLKEAFGRPVKNAPANINLMLMTLGGW